MMYWQKRNIDLFSISKQTNYSIEQLLEMPISEYYMTMWTLAGYNKKMKELSEKSNPNKKG